ncbi:MAG TPA: cation:dicarboxylase symporter family transporter [Terriglobia bacterium]|nr:cation:dicarboxylase symporter family transporter [Terriglobia bacterium]
MKKYFLLIAVISLTVATLLAVASQLGAVRVPNFIPLLARSIVPLALLAYAAARRSLTVWIFVAMLVGLEIGLDWPQAALHLKVLSQIFLRLISVIIAPLLFSTLVTGIAGHSNLKKTGRMGIKALVYFEVVTTLALFIGLAAINLSKAGVGVRLPATPASPAHLTKAPVASTILKIFPQNIARSVARNEVLQVVVFSVLFGVALALVAEDKRRPMLAFCESLAEVMFKFTNLVMFYAPVAVAAAIAYTVSQTGAGILLNLLQLLATLYAALVVFILVVLLPIALLARIPLRPFIRALTEPASIAFATASSEAALPIALEKMESFGVPRPVAAFVIPAGYSFNLAGSALYLTLASVFVAQVARIPMSLGSQFAMVFTLMLTSKGVAGVSRAALVILLGTAASFGLPAAPIFILLGIDQLMDMGRTAVNVIGNCLAAAVVARWENELENDRAPGVGAGLVPAR